MAKSPGHAKWPDHKVEERPVRERLTVETNGRTIAESSDVVRVDEDGNPDRYYFPRSDVNTDLLEPSATTTDCPFKGTARYFHLNVGGKRFEDAAWSYETPYAEHQGLAGRLAFYDDKFRAIHVRPLA